jgi:predicted nicotinamide N-methyase
MSENEMMTTAPAASEDTYVGICALQDAESFHVQQLATSGCGVTAVVAILALHHSYLCAEDMDIGSLRLQSCILRTRRNESFLPDYLASRSVAGCTGEDLIESMGLLLRDNQDTLGKVHLTGSFHTYSDVTASCTNANTKDAAVFDFIVSCLQQRKYVVGTFNLQVEGNDAWHHQVIFGANLQRRLVYCFNPLCAYTEQDIVNYVSTPSILLIRRRDVLSRIPPADVDVDDRLFDDESWKGYAVRENIFHMVADKTIDFLVIPANYKGGFAVFESCPFEIITPKDEGEQLPPNVFALFGGDATDTQNRYEIPGTCERVIVHTRRSKDRVYMNQESDFNGERLFVDDIWPGCKVMADYLAGNVDLVRSKYVLELGAGAALPSLICSKLCAQFVCATDYPEPSVLDNIRTLCGKNGVSITNEVSISTAVTHDASAFVVAGLEWGNASDENNVLQLSELHWKSTHACEPFPKFDIIICAELLWRDTRIHQKALLDTIYALLSADGGKALISFAHRPTDGHSEGDDLEFFAAAEASPYSFRVNYVISTDKYRDVGEDTAAMVHLYTLTRG